MNELLKMLYLTAISLSEYAPAEHSPTIVFISAANLQQKICPDQRCNVVGYYDDKIETIYFDEQYDLKKDKYAQGFLVHEIVHFLQHKNGKIDSELNCQQRIKLEQEAYQVQGYFLAQNRLNTIKIQMAIKMLPRACDSS